MEIIVETNRIYAQGNGGKIIAEIDFPEVSPGVFEITHTFVDGSLRGQGVAGKLVEAAVNNIKSRHGKVTASCSYAQKWLERHPAE